METHTNPRTVVDEYVSNGHRYVTYADGDSFAYPIDDESFSPATGTPATVRHAERFARGQRFSAEHHAFPIATDDEFVALADQIRNKHVTCTGERYDVNPGAPEEGSDIFHARPCPAHPDARLPERADYFDLLNHDEEGQRLR